MLIHQEKISPKHNDSFWYEGLIAETNKHELIAMGEIKINRFGEKGLIGTHNGSKDYDNFELKLREDNDLIKIDGKEYCWDMNNWFEIIEKDREDIGAVYDDYDEAIKALKEFESEE